MKKIIILILVLVVIAAGALVVKNRVLKKGTEPTVTSVVAKPGDYERDLPSWPDRSYTLHVPLGYDPSLPISVVLVLHGGGGNSVAAARLACPNGNLNDPNCFSALADREGFAVVYPNGMANPDSSLGEGRRWNAGGGKDGYSCAGGFICATGIDDIQYFRDLLDDVEGTINVDHSRVYATGFSNGGSMSHRLGCELADRIAAIAPLAGGNQFSAVEPCAPGRPVPILDIHGTDDALFPYMGGKSIAPGPDGEGVKISIPVTMSEWAIRNGCNAAPTVESLPDTANDGTTVTSETYTGCKDGGDVIHYKITGGGHTWPRGWGYLPERIIGKTTQDINANEIIWEFFKNHAKNNNQKTPIQNLYKSGDYKESITVDGRVRTYLLHIPANYEPSKLYSLVAVFHGGGGSGEKIASQTGFAAKADKEGFITAFPDGIAHNWNDGRDTTDAFKQGVDDVKFVRMLIENIKGKLPIDSNKIYATGVSNGGIFSHRLGCEMSDVFAAVGPVVGPIATNLVPWCNPAEPVSVVGIQGTADPGIPIQGGEQGGFGGLGDGGFVESADATMRLWAQKNGCGEKPQVTDMPPKVNDGTRVKRYAYDTCRSGAAVYYYIVEGMGHGWPPKRPQAPRLAGPTSQNINATDVIWEFFKAHSK